MNNIAIQSLPCGAIDARRLAALLGIPWREIARHRFPDGIRSIRSTSSVPHPSNAIPLDDILVAALRRKATLQEITA